MESKINYLYISQNSNSINRTISNHSLTEETFTLQVLFTNQAKQIEEISEKLLVYQKQNKRLKQHIADYYNEKLMDSFTKLNLTQSELIEDPEFLKKIENDHVAFKDSIKPQECFSPLLNKFFKISYTVMNI